MNILKMMENVGSMEKVIEKIAPGIDDLITALDQHNAAMKEHSAVMREASRVNMALAEAIAKSGENDKVS